MSIQIIPPPLDIAHSFRVMTAEELARKLGYNPYAIEIKKYVVKHPKTIQWLKRRLQPE